ncbi:aminodeoxychorismate synthase component I [Chryseolinea sp. H1M3-3]|uniref:aminodeoxychorismate synthase component I n=1 Tax=Chryseolinea sp. H1M3-3 TaxID=3034144 RepID=UPI0023EBEF42|nr:aminodeoxychorismate synthase component I [Chryseolinea sp. H1M3-3]
MTLSEFTTKMNQWGKNKIPFFFMVDFEMRKPEIIKLSTIASGDVLYAINGVSNINNKTVASTNSIAIQKSPGSLSDYENKFNQVFKHLSYGDTFLTNLTVATEVKLPDTLKNIFLQCDAKYKLFYKDQFLVFSPETFVKISRGKIYSFPMKGTIDATIPNAKQKILSDKKELAEHVTIVDLIRNDLSQVATDVTVNRFRYIDEVRTGAKNLFQVSSEISGQLSDDYENCLGTILLKLLPAGSVSGAPKPKTLEIIKAVEGEDRGYYTGVFGYFDGNELDSGVMIRFIENRSGKYFYRSGGGITTQSLVESEYQEAIDKVYVPVA